MSKTKPGQAKPLSTKKSEAKLSTPANGNKRVFDALLRRAVPDEATPPEDETSDPASS